MKQQILLKRLNDMLNGKRLSNLYYSSFYLKTELVNSFNILFLNLNEVWYQCTISEGEIEFYETNKPNIVYLKDISDDFKYPIDEINSTIIKTNFYNKPIISLEIKKTKEEFGLLFCFDNSQKIFFYENLKTEVNYLRIICEELPAAPSCPKSD